jgi:heat induced stress protein YflT
MSDRTTVIGVFDDRAAAQRAIAALKRAGFTEKEIGVTTRDGDSADGRLADAGEKKETHATEGAITGVAAGAGVGALWGLGILAGVLPAIGPAIAGGTLAAILSSAAAGAATAGVAGALIGLGIPEDEAKYYDEEFRSGRTLVTVQALGRRAEARSILEQAGGRSMARGAGVYEDIRTENRANVVGKRVAEDEEYVDATLRKEDIEVDRRGRSGTRPTAR